MNVGVFLGHPAHFHYFKNTVLQLKADGHNVFFAVKEKDILEDLLRNANLSYTKVRGTRGNSRWDQAISLLKMDMNMIKFVRSNKLDILIGVPPTFGTRAFSNVPIIVCGEDDADVVPLSSWLLLPFTHVCVSPTTCNNGRWEFKSAHFPGYLELAYLHPNHFKTDASKVKQYGIDVEKPYFIMRFSSLNAHHDSGIQGINTEIAQRLIDILAPHGTIYITSERPLEPQFEQYRIKINPLDMHHVMAFASLYIGDSQTMAAEAGVLGVPFVRFNDFVGRIGYLRELEDVYELGYGIKASSNGSVNALCDRVQELVALPAKERKAVFDARRQKMLDEKIDCAKFLTYFIENYPASVKDTREGGEKFWKKFK